MKEPENLNEKVKIKYYDRINKQLIEIEVDKAVRRTINKFNKREKRQREKLKENNVLSIESLEEIGVEFGKLDFNEEAKEEQIQAEKNHRKLKMKLYKAMRVLTPRQREIVSMYYFEKKTYKEISEKLDISISGVRETLYESYEKMRKIIKK